MKSWSPAGGAVLWRFGTPRRCNLAGGSKSGECPSPPTSLLPTHCDQLPHTATVLSPPRCCIPSSCEPTKPFLPCLSNILSWLCQNEEELQLTSSAFLPQPLSKTVRLSNRKDILPHSQISVFCNHRQRLLQMETNTEIHNKLQSERPRTLSPNGAVSIKPYLRAQETYGGDRATVWPSGDREDQGHRLLLTRQD